jgi:phosphoenolpyruvate carboxykinase (ATP)
MDGKKSAVYRNLASAELIEHAVKRNEAILSNTGALIADTKKYTGRSPQDKFTVIDKITQDKVWFNEGNKKMLPEHAERLFNKINNYLAERDRFVLDCRAGASADGIRLRLTCERAWHSLFAKNMFIHTSEQDHDLKPDFEVFHAPGFLAKPELDHTNSEAAIVIDFSARRVIICGTEYAGEIKKSVFTVLNFLLPNKNILGMHCSANKNKQNEVALFFGLSGTGKTTLSAENTRALIGDDEHGWDNNGVFNFEGGCYAKVIRLSKTDEPEIYNASQKFTSILENVAYDPKSREVDWNDARHTENTRSSYDISFISNACLTLKGGHPKHIIMLTCDAFGVLPPIARLDHAAATYHFINGYTAKVAGTERGVKEPQAVFSACFGAPFMAQYPVVYARLLQEKIKQHKVQCWLVNTGWTGGPYGIGERLSIPWTRRMLHAALDGELDHEAYEKDPIFNLEIPRHVPDIPQKILRPQNTWQDPQAYLAQAQHLARLFHENFQPYSSLLSEEVRQAAPSVK